MNNVLLHSVTSILPQQTSVPPVYLPSSFAQFVQVLELVNTSFVKSILTNSTLGSCKTILKHLPSSFFTSYSGIDESLRLKNLSLVLKPINTPPDLDIKPF